MSNGIQFPTKIRLMSPSEKEIVDGVFGDTLPYGFECWLVTLPAWTGGPSPFRPHGFWIELI
jgi:hypothetical protein